jgi:predicted alpha/beta-fold hydrolase
MSRDVPGQDYILDAHRRGWLVCILNRRGHFAPLLKPQFNFFGSVADATFVCEQLKKARPRAPLMSIGISSGSGLLCRHLGEESNPYMAAVAICPGYNIEKCMARMAYPYGMIILDSVKDGFLTSNESILKHVANYDKLVGTASFQEFIDKHYAMAGYGSAQEYYEKCNPVKVIDNYNVPVLVINAKDGEMNA